MIDPIQILLFSVVVILTVLIVILGWQLLKTLIEVNKILTKVNGLLEGAASISGKLGTSVKDLTGFAHGLKTVLNFLKVIKGEGKS